MNDELARLKAALRANAPQAPVDVRDQAIRTAKEHFECRERDCSKSNDYFAMLKSAFHNTVPQAPPEVRERAISTAMKQFNHHTKGSSVDNRHMGKALNLSAFNSWLRRLIMHFSRSSFALVGSAVALVVGIIYFQFVVTTPLNLQVRNLVNESVDFPVSVNPDTTDSTQSLISAQTVSPQREVFAPNETLKAREQSVSQEKLSVRKSNERMMSMEMEPSGGLMMSMEMEPSGGLMMSVERSVRLDEFQSRVRFTKFSSNPVKLVTEEPMSTFSVDADTASYAFIRANLNEGYFPPKDVVRTEELINYFAYDYAPPETRDQPFAAHVSLMPAPWNDASRLMHIGIKGFELDHSEVPPANLVFLIDTSGSMVQPNKLPLLIRSFKLLLSVLAPDDRVAIVTYAGSAGVVLEPTPVSERSKILDRLERLYAGGSTAGGDGIRLAYRLAEQHMVSDGINRVILATDGDFNVGITDVDKLEEFISRKRSSGVFLSVLGFGMDNYNDDLMQHLAQNGNGNAAYIDSISEARKVFVEQVTSTLVPIAKDVKIQVEFNPATVSEYRLIGYETRMLEREDFRNDKVDAGEVGAGHTVTAIYELTLANTDAGHVPPSRYQSTESELSSSFDDEFAFLKIRYKLPDAHSSTLVTQPVTVANYFDTVNTAPRDVRFATAVAAFGERLRGGRYTGDYGYKEVIALANDALGDDRFGYRREFIQLVRLAQTAEYLNDSLPRREPNLNDLLPE